MPINTRHPPAVGPDRHPPTILTWFGNTTAFEEYLDQAEDAAQSLYSKKFVEETRARYLKFGKDTFMSEPQSDLLQEIADGKGGRR